MNVPSFLKSKKEAEAAFFRPGRHTIIFYDDEEREIKRYQGCTGIIAEHYFVSFSDEFGLKHVRCGSGYSVEEEPDIVNWPTIIA